MTDYICMICGTSTKDSPPDMDDEGEWKCMECETWNDRPSAVLYAAAPDMLAALECAYQKLSFWMDEDKWDAGDEAAMVQIWAAISKAKGADQ